MGEVAALLGTITALEPEQAEQEHTTANGPDDEPAGLQREPITEWYGRAGRPLVAEPHRNGGQHDGNHDVEESAHHA